MTREHRDPYVVLGVGRQASATEVARAYRRAARATHPDSGAGPAVSVERFRAVSDAYDMLRDPLRRAAYDRAHPRAPSVVGRAGGHIVLGAPSPPPVQHPDVTEIALVLSLFRASW